MAAGARRRTSSGLAAGGGDHEHQAHQRESRARRVGVCRVGGFPRVNIDDTYSNNKAHILAPSSTSGASGACAPPTSSSRAYRGVVSNK